MNPGFTWKNQEGKNHSENQTHNIDINIYNYQAIGQGAHYSALAS